MDDEADDEAEARSAGDILARLAAAIGTHDWSGLRGLLANDCEIELVHTGERLGPDAFVALNRDYPGDWHYAADEVVAAGDRGVLRAHTHLDGETFHVAGFASVRSGRVTALLEIWTEAVAPHPLRSNQQDTERGNP